MFAAFVSYVAWGFGTMDTRFFDVSLVDVIYFLAFGLTWPLSIPWFFWSLRK